MPCGPKAAATNFKGNSNLMIRKVKLHILKKFVGIRRHGKATVIADVCTKMNRPLFFVNVYTNV